MAPRGGWRKRHYDAARARGYRLRQQGRRSVYNDTVRWWAHRHFNDNFQDAQQDPRLQRLWRQRQSDSNLVRLEALEDLGILEQDEDGNWQYSNSFMTWILPS